MENEIKKVENQSSIEIGKNSRGYTFTVKAYGDNPKEIKARLHELMKIAKETTEGVETNGE